MTIQSSKRTAHEMQEMFKQESRRLVKAESEDRIYNAKVCWAGLGFAAGALLVWSVGLLFR